MNRRLGVLVGPELRYYFVEQRKRRLFLGMR